MAPFGNWGMFRSNREGLRPKAHPPIDIPPMKPPLDASLVDASTVEMNSRPGGELVAVPWMQSPSDAKRDIGPDRRKGGIWPPTDRKPRI